MQTLVIHGRQPAIGRVELESIYGSEKIRPAGNIASLVDIKPGDFDFSRLGGFVKFAKVLTILDHTDWNRITNFLVDSVPAHAASLEEGKLKLGLSVYGIKTDVNSINRSGLEVKKSIKKSDRSVRIVPNKSLELNSAQVLHNKLTQKLGWELIFVADRGKTIVAQSIAVQDIDAYAARDQARPKRDARVGMLPPKLAQIIINLAIGPYDRKLVCDPKDNKPQAGKVKTILDPFCGSGVVLQEALLMDLNAYGSDIEERMIEYSEANLKWLLANFPVNTSYKLEIGDATNHQWSDKFDVIASEVFLGKPLNELPKREILDAVIRECNQIFYKFLKNIQKQSKPGTRLCLAVPAWKKSNGFIHLPTLDNLEKLGYNRLKFKFSSNDELIYHRSDQIVARELVVLERN